MKQIKKLSQRLLDYTHPFAMLAQRLELRPFSMKHLALTACLGAGILACETENDSSSTAAQGTFHETLSHNGENREFIVYIPSSYDGTQPLPMLLNFHGYGGQAQDFMEWTDMRSLAESENFILVYPQGSLLNGDPHWNCSLPSADNKSSADDFGFVEALIDEISATYSVDTDRVYASGYSNGAFFAYGLACYRSDLVAAIGSVSGTMIGDTIAECDPSHPTAMINIHGTADGVVPYNGGSGYSSIDSVMRYWVDFNDTNQTPTQTTMSDGGTSIERSTYTGGEGDTMVEHFRIQGGDHVWFELDFDGLSTGGLIWEFVSQYNKDGLIEVE